MEPSASNAVLSLQSLVKYYKSYLATDNVSFDLYPGEIVGLLGTNGAGKALFSR